jgi:hypothetical protein
MGATRRGLSISAAMGFIVCSSLFLLMRDDDSPLAQGRAPVPLQLRSNSFPAGGAIPRQFTCDGADRSPELRWTYGPYGTRSFAIVMSDPDAPSDFIHWIAFNIPGGTRELAEGASTRGAMPVGSAEGTNSFGQVGYGGPCPPPGKPHHYAFRICALDRPLSLPPGASRDQIDSVIGGHTLAYGQIIGVYRRSPQ